MKADVTEGSAKLAEAIGNDAEAVICATGFRPSLDLFTPWKVSNLLSFTLSFLHLVCLGQFSGRFVNNLS